MNVNILNILSLTGLKSMSPYILFGLYYGLLATLPIGPSQLLCIRAFLLEGNLGGIAALSGLMLAQLATAISIYCSPIYILLSKPHLLTIVMIPYMVVYCLTINDLPNNDTLRSITSLYDLRIVILFLNSFLFQLLNPILLPSPVLTRLSHLFLFRYSNNILFLVTGVLGWLGGHVTCSHLSKLLLIRIKKDSPIIYLLVKRAIYTTFSIVFALNALIYLGRAPVPFLTVKIITEPHDIETSFWEITEFQDFLWWLFKPWPISFYDPSRKNRGDRYIRNSRIHLTSGFYKVKTSTYYFNKCLTDGKLRLCIAALPSLSIFEKQLERSLAGSHKVGKTYSLHRGWILRKLIRNKIFQKELRDRIKLLDTGSSFSEAVGIKSRLLGRDKKRILGRGKGERVPHAYDPFINNFRGRIPVAQTYLTIDELDLTSSWDELETREKWRRTFRNEKNSIRVWISSGLRRRTRNPLPWDALPAKAGRMFQFIFRNRGKYFYRKRDLEDEVTMIRDRIGTSSGAAVTWEEILNFYPDDRAVFLTYIKQEENRYKFDQIFLSDRFLASGRKRPPNRRKSMWVLQHKIEDLVAHLARNNELYFDDGFDIFGSDGDIRHRKLRNLGVNFAKGRSASVRLVRRYARISDFRRYLLKGSMRSSRRKTLLWEALQDKIRSAFFLRLMEMPTLVQVPVKQLTGSKTEKLFADSRNIPNYQIGQQLTSSSLKRKILRQSNLARSAVAARSDIGPIHNGRGHMLVFQARFRKFIKLPVLIVLKTIGRMLLWQNSEWNKDWTKWKKEIHINCTFDGDEFSQDDLPPRWSKEGIQIKIVYPFQLKPWHCSGKKNRLTPRKKSTRAQPFWGQKSRNKRKLIKNRAKFTYLTVLGYQTDIPFGSIQKQPSFWKPVRKKLIQTCRKKLSLGTKKIYRFLDSRFNLGILLKPSLILLKEFSFFPEVRKVSASSPYNTQPRSGPSDNIKDRIELNSNFDKKDGGSINNSREVQVVSSNISKQLVTQKSGTEKLLSNIADLTTPLNGGIGLSKRDTKLIQVDELDLDYMLKNTDLADVAKFNDGELNSFKEKILKLYIHVAEIIDKCFLVTSISYLKVNRDFCYRFDELVVLHTRLLKIINSTIYKRNLAFSRPNYGFPWFGKTPWLSQAYLYKSIWDLGLDKTLSFNLLSTDNKNSRREKLEVDGGQNADLNPYQLKQSSVYLQYSPKLPSKSNSKASNSSQISNYTDMPFDKASEDEFLNEQVLEYIEKWGFLKKLREVDASNWNKWLDCFSKYNLPLTLWRDVAPYRWGIGLDSLNESQGMGIRIANENNVLQDEVHHYSIYVKNPLLRNEIRNLSRLRKRRNLLQSLTDFVRTGDMQNISIRQDTAAEGLYCKNRISKIVEVKRKGVKRFFNLRTSDSEMKFNSKFDLIPWLVTDSTEMKTISRFGRKRYRPKHPIIKENPLLVRFGRYGRKLDISPKFQDLSDQLYRELIDEREFARYLFRWKWKSEAKVRNLRSLLALTRMLGDDEDLLKLCRDMDVDSEILALYFKVKSRLDIETKMSIRRQLRFNSAHRVPILFDDENLIYKIIHPFLRFKSRLRKGVKKRLYRKIYSDTYISKISFIAKEGNKKRIYNIGDILLPRRRREFRFLRSLLMSRSTKTGVHELDSRFDSLSKIERTHTSKEFQPLELTEVQKIKRFLWPSHRLEELACTGRFCFNLITGSRFTILKIRMYPVIRN
uniref:Ycf1 n=1 Tax=Asplenium castaneoviride TaxID=2601855 RepID=UPI0023AB1FA8|nr:Ycf1 [Asplenium castaneoviride]WCL38415.1 Ycf1 [Asplenium castaneoviride]